MCKQYPLIIGNQYQMKESLHTIYNKYTGEPYAAISAAGPEDVDAAMAAA